jgi:hypothetical protein
MVEILTSPHDAITRKAEVHCVTFIYEIPEGLKQNITVTIVRLTVTSNKCVISAQKLRLIVLILL